MISSRHWIIRALRQMRKPATLAGIQRKIVSMGGPMYETTNISAKIRNYCRDMLAASGETIINKQHSADNRAHVYWIAKL